MSQGLCPSCGAAVSLTAGQTETKCQFCDSVVTLQQAEAQFSAVRKSNIGGTLMLAEAAWETGDYQEAGEYYNKVIEQEPRSAEAWFYKGSCLWHGFNFDCAGSVNRPRKSWETAIQLASRPDAMKKRVATEIHKRVVIAVDAEVSSIDRYERDTAHLDHDPKLKALYWVSANLGARTKLSYAEDSLSLALEMYPTSRAIAETGIKICDCVIKRFHHATFSDVRGEMQTARCKYAQALKAIDPSCKTPPAIPPSCLRLPDRVTDLIFEGQKLAAIKELRTIQAGLGLAEAVGIIEKAESDLRAVSPERFVVNPKKEKAGCFVATACYGDYAHPVVMELRHFRDNCLEASIAGRAFVRWYYQWSPAFASLAAKHGILKTLARVLIVTPALIIARAVRKESNK